MARPEQAALAMRLDVERSLNGLADVRFAATGAHAATAETLCAEANRLYEALDAGAFRPLDFGDATHLRRRPGDAP